MPWKTLTGLMLGLLLGLQTAFGQTEGVEKRPIPEAPFAKHKVALQISTGGETVQKRVLTVARMLLQEYGMDRIAIEIVAFGPGMKLLLADAGYDERIRSLAKNGVRLSVCSNSYRFMAERRGSEPELHDKAVLVPSGAARLLRLEDAGYTIIKP